MIPDWMAVFSSGPKTIVSDAQYDSIVSSNVGDDGRDERVTMSDSDPAFPSQKEVHDRYDE
ncbi:hypothetical protein [Natrinema salinisoli]|uniref:hypothetical protein n=1 Tax=Natrinema salinisoli TaxID=2878535 RepID=UPI001CEFCF8B|nr:hypothetical protein [Natrinema salinisoli]